MRTSLLAITAVTVFSGLTVSHATPTNGQRPGRVVRAVTRLQTKLHKGARNMTRTKSRVARAAVLGSGAVTIAASAALVKDGNPFGFALGAAGIQAVIAGTARHADFPGALSRLVLAAPAAAAGGLVLGLGAEVAETNSRLGAVMMAPGVVGGVLLPTAVTVTKLTE